MADLFGDHLDDTPRRVLVTGGAGFIGSHLVDALIGAGHAVTVFDNLRTGSLQNLTAAVKGGSMGFLGGSVTWQQEVEHAFEEVQPEVVFHLAAQIDVRTSAESPAQDAMTNVMGTLHVLDTARRHGVGRFVLASSAATLADADPGHPPDLGERYAPISPYGASKAAAEIFVEQHNAAAEAEGRAPWASTVVFSNVYGPRQRANRGAVNIFTRRLLAGEPVTLYGDGKNIRDYLHVDDAVRALMSRGFGPLVGRILVGTGVGTTDAELLSLVAREVATQTGRTGPDEDRMMPGRNEAARPCDIRSMVFPRWRHAVVDLTTGVRRTVEAIREELGVVS